MEKIKVKAAPGVQVPREDSPRRYIDPDAVTEVERTAYYLRQISAGDLLIVPDETTVATAKKEKGANATSNSEEVNRGKS